MKTGNRILIITFSTLTLFLVAGYLYLKQYMPKHNWKLNLDIESEQPYGLKLTYEILQEGNFFTEFKKVEKPLFEEIEKNDTNSLVFYIGNYYRTDSLSLSFLKEFIEKGNDMFFCSKEAMNQVHSLFFEASTDGNIELVNIMDPIISTSILDNKNSERPYMFHYQYLKDTIEYAWLAKKPTINNYSITDLGSVEDSLVNFWKIRYGNGHIYFHSHPLLFTNYHIAKEDKFEYFNRVLNTMGNQYEYLYWDEYNKTLPSAKNTNNGFSDSPFIFILENKSLRWAFYLSLGLILLYIAFHIKRRQRPIALYPFKENTSISYAKALGTLYFQHSNKSELAKKLFDVFKLKVNQKYGIPIELKKQSTIERIAKKSGVERKLVESIFKLYFSIRYDPNPQKSDTIKLYNQLEMFYSKCK